MSTRVDISHAMLVAIILDVVFSPSIAKRFPCKEAIFVTIRK